MGKSRNRVVKRYTFAREAWPISLAQTDLGPSHEILPAIPKSIRPHDAPARQWGTCIDAFDTLDHFQPILLSSAISPTFSRPVSTGQSLAMLHYRTQGFNGCAVKYSPFFDNRLAVASAANFGLVGNGRLFILELTPNGIVPVKW